MSASGHHRHVPRRALARHGLRAPPPLHGRDRRRLPLLGLRPRRHRRDLQRHRGDAAREAGVEIRTKAPIAKIKLVRRQGHGRRARERRGDRRPRRLLERRPAADLHEDGRREGAARATSSRTSSATSSAARRARSTSPSTRCPTSSRCPGPGAHLRGAISISPSVEYMERAYDDAKYGRFSRRPYIDMVIPTLTDPSLAPPGQARHVLLRPVRAVQPEGRDWDKEREAFGDTVVDTIAEHAPNIKNIIKHRQVVTPLDLEREWGLSEGNIFQGELTLEQLFFLRPAPGWAQYRTPIKNLYMCGSATHPGGGIMGANGKNAAEKLLEDWKRGKGLGDGREERRRRHRRRAQRPRPRPRTSRRPASSSSSSSGARSSAASRSPRSSRRASAPRRSSTRPAPSCRRSPATSISRATASRSSRRRSRVFAPAPDGRGDRALRRRRAHGPRAREDLAARREGLPRLPREPRPDRQGARAASDDDAALDRRSVDRRDVGAPRRRPQVPGAAAPRRLPAAALGPDGGRRPRLRVLRDGAAAGRRRRARHLRRLRGPVVGRARASA